MSSSKNQGIKREDIRAHFRKVLKQKSISKFTQEKGYTYKWVITTYELDEDRAARYLDAGWDVVYDELAPDDDRTFVPGKTENDQFSRIKPVTKRLKGGHQAILMKISEEQRLENHKKRRARDKARELASIKGSQSKRIRTAEGGIEEITQSEVDLGESNQE